MVLICPHCGARVPADPRKPRAKCPNCKRFVPTGMGKTGHEVKLPFTPTKKEGEGKVAEKGKGGWGRVRQTLVLKQATNLSGRSLKTIAVAAIMAIVLFVNPLLDPVKASLLELTAIFVPNIADFWGTIVLVVSLGLVGLAALSVWYTNSSIVGGIFVGAIIVAMIGFTFASPYLESGYGSDYAVSLACMLQNVGNSEGMAACQIQSTNAYEDPEAKKVGSYDVLRVSLSTEYTGSKIIKSGGNLIFNTYFIDLVVENPSDTETIKNFKIIDKYKDTLGNKDTALVRSGVVKSSEKIKLANLETLGRECMDEAVEGLNEYCDIEPGETLRLTLKAIPILCDELEYEVDCELRDICEWVEDEDGDWFCESKADRKTKEVEARVTFEYDYAGEGKFDFVVANSYEALWALISNRAQKTKSDGPVDVQVSFGPTAYLLRETYTDPKVSVIIELSKDKTGKAWIKSPISIKRLSDGVLSPPSGCTAPWGPIDLDTPEDRIEELKLQAPMKLTRLHTYVCTYTIDKIRVGDDGEVIPFIVSADYTYEKTVTKKYIDAQEETWI